MSKTNPRQWPGSVVLLLLSALLTVCAFGVAFWLILVFELAHSAVGWVLAS